MVYPEKCPDPVELNVEGCQDSVLVDLGDVYLESQGRIIQMDVTPLRMSAPENEWLWQRSLQR